MSKKPTGFDINRWLEQTGKLDGSTADIERKSYQDDLDLIDAHADKREYTEAAKVCDRAMRLKLPPEIHSDVVSAKLRALRELKQYKEAVETLESEIEKNPSDIRLYAWLGSFYRDLGEPEKAVEALKRGLEVKSVVNDRTFFFATELVSSGMHGEAIGQFEMDTDPNYIEIAECLVALGRYEEAMEFIIKEEGRGDAYSYYKAMAKFDTLVGLGRHEKALDVLYNAIDEEDKPNTLALIYMDLGSLLFRIGDREMAIEAFHKTLEYDPDAVGIYKAIIRLVQDVLDHPEELLELYEKMITMQPNFMDAYNAKFELESELGYKEDAEETRRKIMQITSKN